MKRKRSPGSPEARFHSMLDSTANHHRNMANNIIRSILPRVEENETNVKSWTDTEIKIAKATHTWRIRNFSACLNENGESLKSESFSSGAKEGDRWHIVLYPNGYKEAHEGYLSVYLRLESCKKALVPATFRLFLHNEETEILKSKQLKHIFKIGFGHGVSYFIKKQRLLETRQFLPKDTLTLSCEVMINGDISNVSSNEIPLNTKIPSPNLLENLGQMLNTGKLSDVTLVTGRREFPVHKLILSAQSSVFSAMFEHEMVERRQNRVDIIDLDSDVTENMPRFIYTGKVENIEGMAESLLFAADKYGIDSLKFMCADQLNKSLSIENACHILMLADLHNVDWLKSQAINFINMNKVEVMITEGFKAASTLYPHLIVEVFIDSVMQKKDNSNKTIQPEGHTQHT